MKFTVNRLKKLALLLTLPLLATAILNSMPTVHAGTALQDFDAATVFKAKCMMCHGAKAEKKFDSTVSDEQLLQIVMKGKKGEKPPFMPEYESKGLTADQAKGLIAYMKQLRVAAAELPK